MSKLLPVGNVPKRVVPKFQAERSEALFWAKREFKVRIVSIDFVAFESELLTTVWKCSRSRGWWPTAIANMRRVQQRLPIGYL